MVQHDEDEDLWYETLGYIRRRGDDSRSPNRADRRERSHSDDSLVGDSSGCHSRRSSPDYDRGRPLTQRTMADAEARSRLSCEENHQGSPTISSSARTSLNSGHLNGATSNHVARVSEAVRGTRALALRVKQPTDDEDLTKDEFDKYQARYGIRRKISMNQILQGTSDEDAEDPTLGNRRTQMCLNEDGTVERRDFDNQGGFQYAPLGALGKAKMPERRARSIEELSRDD